MSRSDDRYFVADARTDDLGRASLRSGAIMMAARIVNIAVQLGSTILIARMLEPRDFGLAAMVLAFTVFAPFLVDLGTTDAVTHERDLSRQHVSTLFWLNVSVGSVLTLAFAAGSGLLAATFGEASLIAIALVASLTFILTASSIQHYALMRRSMEFDRIAINDVSANVIASIVAVTAALLGAGYWALIVKPLLTIALMSIGVWMLCPWTPGRPRIDANTTQMVRFGLGVTGFTLTDTLTRSVDRIAVGWMFGAGPLGLFQSANLLYANLIGVLSESIYNVVTSHLTRLKDNASALKHAWASALTLVSFGGAGLFSLVAVTSTDVVVLLLGSKWAAAGPLLCLFALRGIPQSVERTIGWLHVAAGRPDRWSKWGLVSAVVQLTALAVGLQFGMMGVCVAYAIALAILFVPAVAYAGAPLGIHARDVLSAAGPQVAAGFLTVAVGLTVQSLWLDSWAIWPRFLTAGLLSVAVYLTLVVGVCRVTAPLRLISALARDVTEHRAGNTISRWPSARKPSP